MKKKKYPKHILFVNKYFDLDATSTSSMQECTGLIPWWPDNDDELDSYDDIQNYSPESANIYNYFK